jgi:hypothetical protein
MADPVFTRNALAGTDPNSGLDYSNDVGAPLNELAPVTSGDMWMTRLKNLPPWSGRGRGPATQYWDGKGWRIGQRTPGGPLISEGEGDLSQYLQARQDKYDASR